ncbi:hypothetical protein [Lederbergia galactosidilytica]|uniref:hypothetical protein n=1 Tax=Lederbergia galactosidilytica TaxID=217031 RepID=UPI0007140808|nr:hypothetical protein [Lederbergia galactosidilytica]KRG12082.1 hypothetical protein ACA30_20820 [Virgibacillus soli]MBP1913550.1 preprotein translocase subunit SecA [Lederbergia galactosidilytica]
MDTGLYLDQELLELSQDQIDTVFAGYYEENANGNFYEMKKVVLAKIDEKWKEVLSDCFDLYEQGKIYSYHPIPN